MKPNRSLIAFLLAGVTVGILFTCFNCLSSATLSHDGVVVRTSKETNVDQTVAAINALNLNGVQADKISRFSWDFENVMWTLIAFTVGCMIVTGFVLFFYKLYCRWLSATHHF